MLTVLLIESEPANLIALKDEVICPWHGSRFNLKTGAVLTPPAQRNVKSFPVRIVGSDVEVQIE